MHKYGYHFKHDHVVLNKKYLTPLGKITMVKTFLLAKLNHLFIPLPNPDDSCVKEINELLFKFIWSSKPDKINRYTVMLDKKIGGLKMINIKILLHL